MNIDWVFEKPRELAQGRVSQAGSQTELSVPPGEDSMALLAITRPVKNDLAIEAPEEMIEAEEAANNDANVVSLISRKTQTDIHLHTRMQPKDLKNVYMQLVCLRASNRSISVLSDNSKRYYHVENCFRHTSRCKVRAKP